MNLFNSTTDSFSSNGGISKLTKSKNTQKTGIAIFLSKITLVFFNLKKSRKINYQDL